MTSVLGSDSTPWFWVTNWSDASITLGSISQMTIRSTSGYRTKDPAVTPAPMPTTSTLRGAPWTSAGTCPSIRSIRMSRSMVEATTLPLM